MRPLMLIALAAPSAYGQLATSPLACYDGKYANNTAFKSLAGRIPELRAKALKSISTRLGLAVEQEDCIRIELRDALPARPEKIIRFTKPPFGTTYEDAKPLVFLYTEFMFNGSYDLETELTHELTHAVMRALMKPAAYGALPEWVREGLAVWTAEQVDEKAVWLIRAQDGPVKPADLLRGLGDESEGLERYAEYGLAIDALEKKQGAAAVRTFARLIVEGKNPPAAVGQSSGEEFAEFCTSAREHARRRIEQIAPPDINIYFELRRADKQRDYKTVVAKANQLLKAGARSPLSASVLYFKGKACRMLGKTGEAEETLRQLLGQRDRACEWIENGIYQLGKARVEGKKFSEAADLWQRLLRDHPHSEELDNALYYLALCRAKAGGKAEARRLLDLLERSFPASDYSSKAAELRRTLR
ncbi:MAG: tetratricopeptide repeat protein [Planctomycetes bacterium]|nr:tetratricopeptide repeat protein [Planctomycetota bacterium]